MTFAAGFFGIVGICVFGSLILLIVAAWREDRAGRSQRALEQAAVPPVETSLASIRLRCRYGRFPFLLG
jgi:uncharacterized membrane protein